MEIAKKINRYKEEEEEVEQGWNTIFRLKKSTLSNLHFRWPLAWKHALRYSDAALRVIPGTLDWLFCLWFLLNTKIKINPSKVIKYLQWFVSFPKINLLNYYYFFFFIDRKIFLERKYFIHRRENNKIFFHVKK